MTLVHYFNNVYEMEEVSARIAHLRRYDSDQVRVVDRINATFYKPTNKEKEEYMENKTRYEIAKAEKYEADKRYNKPKAEPSASIEEIEEVIGSTEIYRRARALINSSQRRQIGYGMEKYPEPLNADTWSEIETIDHIIEESIDKLHYLVMLRIKLESKGNS